MRRFRMLVLAGALLGMALPVHATQDVRSNEYRELLQRLRAMQRTQAESMLADHQRIAELLHRRESVDAERLHTELSAERHAVELLEAELLGQQAHEARPDVDHLRALIESESTRHVLEAERLAELEVRSRLLGRGMDEAAFEAALNRLAGDGPRAASVPQDPADSLWRRGRELFNTGQYRNAATTFARIRTENRFANSAYRIDAHYWEAFALSRLGEERDLEQARDLLRTVVRYPPSQRTRDADGLLVTVEARLARLGNREAEEALVARATPTVVTTWADGVAAANAANVEYARALQDVAVVSQDAQEVALRAAELQAMNGVWLFPSLSYSLPRQCRTDEHEIRMVALNALARLDAQTALPVLREVMARRGECTEHLRRQALSVAARQRTPEATQLIMDAARNDPDSSVRTTALQMLVQIDEERALTLIEERLRAGSDTSAMREAISALGSRNRSDRANRILRDAATRPGLPTSLRRDAIRSLSRSDDAETRRALRSLYTQSTDQEIREALLSAATTTDTESVDWLLQIAMDARESDRMRQRALSMAGRNRAMTADRLATVYDRVSEATLKRSVVGMLGSRARNESAATDKLLAIARNETDVDIRKAAIMALASSDDPRARDLLLDILRR